MKFDTLLLDLDDTILDFGWAEGIALRQTLEQVGVPATEAVCQRYSQINADCWKLLEQGKLTRSALMVRRFALLFQELGTSANADEAAAVYPERLSHGHRFLPGAKEALETLSQKYRLYLVSNGTAHVQAGRLDSSGIRPFFRDIFISQEVGVDKPDVEFFNRCFAQIGDVDNSRTLIVGDSLTSDILGGNRAGIATCWVNPRHLPRRADLRIDFEIEALSQLDALLDSL